MVPGVLNTPRELVRPLLLPGHWLFLSGAFWQVCPSHSEEFGPHIPPPTREGGSRKAPITPRPRAPVARRAENRCLEEVFCHCCLQRGAREASGSPASSGCRRSWAEGARNRSRGRRLPRAVTGAPARPSFSCRHPRGLSDSDTVVAPQEPSFSPNPTRKSFWETAFLHSHRTPRRPSGQNVWAHREEACRERRRLKGRDGGCDGASPVPVKEEPWKIGPRWQSVLAAAACGAPCATSDRVRQLAWSSRLRVKEASPKRPPDLNLGILLGHGPGAPSRVVRRT
ncbi:uncharacterized protein LOC121103148 [Ursus maritimus]|uniref:Uncharacterized protein LOC121103148 n=1 Tax=Ursus maritimus TaxID=29073 RepID=A0A8M1G7Y9_URSMA|nr:uncharacterized protein LOC121103148 [Ursus maritimus]